MKPYWRRVAPRNVRASANAMTAPTVAHTIQRASASACAQCSSQQCILCGRHTQWGTRGTRHLLCVQERPIVLHALLSAHPVQDRATGSDLHHMHAPASALAPRLQTSVFARTEEAWLCSQLRASKSTHVRVEQRRLLQRLLLRWLQREARDAHASCLQPQQPRLQRLHYLRPCASPQIHPFGGASP